jgi:cysteine desulfurase
MRKCYFDHVATNPLHPDVLEAMMPYFKEEFGNPLSIYEYGTRAKNAIEGAREKVAGLVNAKPAEIIFTASGAEANNFALRGIALQSRMRASMSGFEDGAPFDSELGQVSRKSGFVVTYLLLTKRFVAPDTVKRR